MFLIHHRIISVTHFRKKGFDSCRALLTAFLLKLSKQVGIKRNALKTLPSSRPAFKHNAISQILRIRSKKKITLPTKQTTCN